MIEASPRTDQGYCQDCGEATTPCTGRRGCSHRGKWEFFMVHRTVWRAEAGADSGYLCVGCLERRIGRRLRPGDFTDYPINDWRDPDHTERLRNRLTGGDPRVEDYFLEEGRRILRQRFEALAIANRHRSTVAREREEIASLSRPEAVERLAELIETATDPALLSGRILHYLGAIPDRGGDYANRAATAAGVTDPRARLRDLDENERAALASEVRRLA